MIRKWIKQLLASIIREVINEMDAKDNEKSYEEIRKEACVIILKVMNDIKV